MLESAVLFGDFRLIMDEFRANGRESPLDDPAEADTSGSTSRGHHPCRLARSPPSPAEWQRRDVLWSPRWRTWPGYRHPSAICDSGDVYYPAERIFYGIEDATGEMYQRGCRPDIPFGGRLVPDPRPLGGGRGDGLDRPPLGKRSDSPLLRPPRSGRSGMRKRTKQPNHCVFCKNNNELPCVYRSHILKDGQGRVSCPILRVYTCPTCGANGDTAHTVKYCPQRQAGAGPASPPRPLGRPITGRHGDR